MALTHYISVQLRTSLPFETLAKPLQTLNRFVAYTNIEKRRATWNRWYKKNAKKHQRSVAHYRKLRKKKIRAWFAAWKTTLKCSRCPETHPACLDFHHRDPKEKVVEVSVAVVRGGWSVEHIQREIAKCDVLCSNCHRKLHDALSSNG